MEALSIVCTGLDSDYTKKVRVEVKLHDGVIMLIHNPLTNEQIEKVKSWVTSSVRKTLANQLSEGFKT